MNDLNYHHLRYFWVTAREGSLTQAGRTLGLAPSTLSTQIRSLEASMGQDLFERRGRTLVLTPHGEVVKKFADDIFALGEELLTAVRRSSPAHSVRLRVGVTHHIPKLVVYRLLRPALRETAEPVHLVVLQDTADRLVADLASHHLDMVLTDTPVGLASDLRMDSVLVGECGITVMATNALLHFREGFPQSMHGAPMLLPDTTSSMRRLLDTYFQQHDIHPHVVAEIADSALLKGFGHEGVGLFPVPSLVVDAVIDQYRVVPIGEVPGAVEQFYMLVPPGLRGTAAIDLILTGAGLTGV